MTCTCVCVSPRRSEMLVAVMLLALFSTPVEEQAVQRMTRGARVEVRQLWTTPVSLVSLAESGVPSSEVEEFNTALRAAALKALRAVAEAHGYVDQESDRMMPSVQHVTLDLSSSSASQSSLDLNTLFFQWQREQSELDVNSQHHAYREFIECQAMRKLQRLVQVQAETYLKSAVGRDDVDVRTQPLFVWAAVAFGGMSHLSHVHPEAMVSGVYYASIPQDAGSIVFDDPRSAGPLPPFEGRLHLQPKEGDLFLFPGWLVHQVAPTPGEDVRVAFSFNVVGDWGVTSDVNRVRLL